MADDALSIARADVEAFNEGDWDRMREHSAQGAVYDEPATGRKVKGIDAILETNRGWKQAFPDARGTVTSALACGSDVAVLEVTWSGTHSGPLRIEGGEIPASNRRIEVRAVQVVETSEGKVREVRHYFDLLGMLEQIGMVSTEQMAGA